MEVWVGLLGVRQLPGSDHQIELKGKATDAASCEAKVSEAMAYYGLFIVELDDVMPFRAAEENGSVTDELLKQFTDTAKDKTFCLYGTFHKFPMVDN